MKPSNLDDYVLSNESDDIYAEIRHTIQIGFPETELAPLDTLFNEVKDLFEGRYPGYRASNTKYHDLQHTCLVTLAMARLMHGFMLGNRTAAFTTSHIYVGIAAAFFHDTGLIQETSDTNGTGAKYTVGHEARSIHVLEKVLGRHAGLKDLIQDGGHAIQCTLLTQSPEEIPFRSESFQRIGCILGSADLLAQLADRGYIEKLLLLFEEFQEARFPTFDTALDLLKKTRDFYENNAKRRLNETLGNVASYMIDHFRQRWGIDHDPYAASITQNISYLSRVLNVCGDSFPCYRHHLRRGGVATSALFSGGRSAVRRLL